MKFKEGKLDWNLVDYSILEYLVKVLQFGLQKGYSKESWKNTVPKDYYAASQRHLAELMKGNMRDKESGLPHAAHLMANAYFLTFFEDRRRYTDGY